MKLKRIAFSIFICIGLFFLVGCRNTEKVLQSSSYAEMFGLENIGIAENTPEHKVLENMTIDIIEIFEGNNYQTMATVDINMPDIIRIALETADDFQHSENFLDIDFNNALMSNIENHFITFRREIEVIEENGKWNIVDRSEIDNILFEQGEQLLIELILRLDMEPIR